MFSKISRYRKLADVVTVDAEGRQLASKELRLQSGVTGAFQHVISAGDRLDQLAYKYYDQPRKWWRICDANPQFLSPLALLGQEAVIAVRYTLALPDGGAPPWARLFAGLCALPGVETVLIEENVTHTPPSRSVVVTYNRLQVAAAGLTQAISDAGFKTDEPAALDRLGQAILIPPDAIG